MRRKTLAGISAESFDLFLDMMDRVKVDTVQKLYAVHPAREELTREQPAMFFNMGNEPPQEKKDKEDWQKRSLPMRERQEV